MNRRNTLFYCVIAALIAFDVAAVLHAPLWLMLSLLTVFLVLWACFAKPFLK